MKPSQPTPHETAQWIMETHTEYMLGEMSESEHDDYLADLELVCREMNAGELGSALDVVVAIAQEFSIELADSGVGNEVILELVRHGRGRENVTSGLPRHPSQVGSASAFRLASLIADVALCAPTMEGNGTLDLEAVFEAKRDKAEAAICTRTFSQLFLTGYYLKEFSRALRDAGAQTIGDTGDCRSPNGAACRGHITCTTALIRAQSEAMSTLWPDSTVRVGTLHREFFALKDCTSAE